MLSITYNIYIICLRCFCFPHMNTGVYLYKFVSIYRWVDDITSIKQSSDVPRPLMASKLGVFISQTLNIWVCFFKLPLMIREMVLTWPSHIYSQTTLVQTFSFLEKKCIWVFVIMFVLLNMDNYSKWIL